MLLQIQQLRGPHSNRAQNKKASPTNAPATAAAAM